MPSEKQSSFKFCVVSDTVGFISDLPICLFAAFRATLEEASHADAILHVIDANANDMKQQRQEVYKVIFSTKLSFNFVFRRFKKLVCRREH